MEIRKTFTFVLLILRVSCLHTHQLVTMILKKIYKTAIYKYNIYKYKYKNNQTTILV